jgi:hypothetical protein
MGVKAQGERVAKAAPAAGCVWRYHRWETQCAQPRGGDVVTWLQKRKLEKNKTIEKTRKYTRIPAVPVLGVGVLTGLGERTLTPTRAGYTQLGNGYLVPVPIPNLR